MAGEPSTLDDRGTVRQAPTRLHRAGQAPTPTMTVPLPPGPPRPARTSALDVLAPPLAADDEPDDAITALLTLDEHAVSQRDRDQFAALNRWQRDRAMHERAYKALGKDIKALTAELLDRRVERAWHGKLPATVNDVGEPVQPYVRATIWPRFREDPDTGEKCGRPDVVAALPDAGLAHLIVTGYDTDAFTAAIREQVKAWRAEAGETGVVNDRGELVDAHGAVLTDAEQADPTADILGIHPALRHCVEAVVVEEIRFSRG